MFSLIAIVILVLGGLLLILRAKKWFPNLPEGTRLSRDQVNPKILRRVAKGIGIVALAWGLFISWNAMTVQIEPSDVGIKTAFGHTQGGDLRPGLHLKAPWEAVTVWDASNQREEWTGDKCLQIRISGGQNACLDVILQWSDDPADADHQFIRFRTFANVGKSLISKAIVTGFFNTEFEKFDPVAAAAAATCTIKKGQDPAEAAKGCVNQQGGTQISTLVDKVLADLKTAKQGQIFVTALKAGNIGYDTQINDALNKLILARQQTLTAIQDEQTALAKSEANKQLQEKQTLTPTILYYDCLQITLQLANPPAAWSCSSPKDLSILVGAGK